MATVATTIRMSAPEEGMSAAGRQLGNVQRAARGR